MPAKGEVSPWNPSRKAVARVPKPLPAPTTCHLCAGAVELVPNSEVYNGKDYGEWPWTYLCRGCGSYVGLHPFTGIPLGTLANKQMRAARQAAKAALNPLWQHGGPMTRTEAYAWLSQQLGIADIEDCHIGYMDVDQCRQIMAAIGARAPAQPLVGVRR